jgi:preprotein translocase subunit SecD
MKKTLYFVIALAGLALLNGCTLFGWQKPVTVRICDQVQDTLPEAYVRAVKLPKLNLSVTVNSAPAVTERDVASAELRQSPGGATILLRFDIHGVMALEEMTTRSRGRYIVTFLNGRPVAAWLVDRRITDGQILLEGDFDDEEAKRVVSALNNMAKSRR